MSTSIALLLSSCQLIEVDIDLTKDGALATTKTSQEAALPEGIAPWEEDNIYFAMISELTNFNEKIYYAKKIIPSDEILNIIFDATKYEEGVDPDISTANDIYLITDKKIKKGVVYAFFDVSDIGVKMVSKFSIKNGIMKFKNFDKMELSAAYDRTNEILKMKKTPPPAKPSMFNQLVNLHRKASDLLFSGTLSGCPEEYQELENFYIDVKQYINPGEGAYSDETILEVIYRLNTVMESTLASCSIAPSPVEPPPPIQIALYATIYTGDRYVTEGQRAGFDTAISGLDYDLPWSCQWYTASAEPDAVFELIPNYTNCGFSINPATMDLNGRKYFFTVSNGDNISTSKTVTLYVSTEPLLTPEPLPLPVPSAEPLTPTEPLPPAPAVLSGIETGISSEWSMDLGSGIGFTVWRVYSDGSTLPIINREDIEIVIDDKSILVDQVLNIDNPQINAVGIGTTNVHIYYKNFVSTTSVTVF